MGANRIRPGQCVRVHPEVSHPRLEWGMAHRNSSGLVQSITHDGIVEVDFHGFLWYGLLSELDVGERTCAPLVRKRIALVIGNQEYTDTANYPPLMAASKDARKMEEKLRSIGFDFVHKVENIYHTDMASILRQLEQEVEHGSIVVIYFAGHGEVNYLVAKDSQADDASTKIHVDNIFNAISQWHAADMFVCFIFDCCRLKSDETSASRISAETAPSPEQIAKNQYYWAHSCQKFQPASETKDQGAFTQWLLHLLDQNMSVTELFEKVTSELGPRQRPSILLEAHQASAIKLASAQNVYTPSDACQLCQAASSSQSGSGSSEAHQERVDCYKASLEEKDPEPVELVEGIWDLKDLLPPKLHNAVGAAALERIDSSCLSQSFVDECTSSLNEWELQLFRHIFSSFLPHERSCFRGPLPDWVHELQRMIRADVLGGGHWSSTCALCLERSSPRLANAIQTTLSFLFRALAAQVKQLTGEHELPSLPADCLAGEDLLDHLFDEEFVAKIAFIMKLVEEGHESARSEAAQVIAVLSNFVLQINDGLKSAMSELLVRPEGVSNTADWKLDEAEGKVVRRVLGRFKQKKCELLASIPPTQRVFNMLDVLLPHLRDCVHGAEEGWI